MAYEKTLKQDAKIRKAGYALVVRWENEKPRPWSEDPLPKIKTQTYPHALMHDFEAYLDRTKAHNSTKALEYENEHTAISLSLADT
ncbi:hypothetical protein QZH41_005204 [Actinostola sp. cb2023]|nr:hypothetical protein QZH41_005204 [Actinostola sp. cb2023]